jgi:hypothetical protein
MVAMQVGNKNVIDPGKPDFVPVKLHLSGLSAIYQKIILLNMQQLGSWMTVVGRCSRIRTQYFKYECQWQCLEAIDKRKFIHGQ